MAPPRKDLRAARIAAHIDHDARRAALDEVVERLPSPSSGPIPARHAEVPDPLVEVADGDGPVQCPPSGHGFIRARARRVDVGSPHLMATSTDLEPAMGIGTIGQQLGGCASKRSGGRRVQQLNFVCIDPRAPVEPVGRRVRILGLEEGPQASHGTLVRLPARLRIGERRG